MSSLSDSMPQLLTGGCMDDLRMPSKDHQHHATPVSVLDAVRMLTSRMSPPSVSQTKMITSARYEQETDLNRSRIHIDCKHITLGDHHHAGDLPQK